MFDMLSFCQDFEIEFSTSGSKVTRGWLGVHCPFCGGGNFHLGFNLKTGHFTCWKCGAHSIDEYLREKLPYNARKGEVWGKYWTEGTESILGHFWREKRHAQECHLPSQTMEMNEAHKKYLRGRGFDPEQLMRMYGIKGTGPIGPYARRIIIPITYKGKLLSYQGRDISGKSKLKYKACATDKEVISHHELLYGMDLVPGDSVVVVEGVFDAWRLGPGAVATFGIKFKDAQVKLLAENFERITVLYDYETFAVAQAKKMCAMLASLGRKVTMVTLSEGDPGDLTPDDAAGLMCDLLK